MQLVPHTFVRWLAPALLACAGQAHALGMEMPYESFATAPDVDWIKVCGQWPAPEQPGESRGMYRIVHASRYAQAFWYVQWIVRDGRHPQEDAVLARYRAVLAGIRLNGHA